MTAIPRVRIAHLPTAVEPMSRLSAHLGGPKLWVKRDDQTGLGFGGNKTRKLEFVLAEALAVGAKTLVTVGGIQSNHCRQTAALAARYGLDCILVLNGTQPEIPTGNLILNELFGAKIVWTTRPERDARLKQVFDEAWAEGKRPFLIPLGASTPTGALGYESAMAEFMQQGVEVDWIVVASSSAGTQAGMALGALRHGFPGKVLGISIDSPEQDLQQAVAHLATEAADRMGEKTVIKPEDILVNADYLGAGYAIMGEPEMEAIRLTARFEGLVLDPVYTGRAMAGMIGLIRQGFFKPTDRVLFWHTGGGPTLFAEPYVKQFAGK